MVLLGAWIVASQAHQDSCHQRHSCPSITPMSVAIVGDAINARIINTAYPASRI
jgi:hypothetical protein